MKPRGPVMGLSRSIYLCLLVLASILHLSVQINTKLNRLGCNYFHESLVLNCERSTLDQLLEAVRHLDAHFSATVKRIPVRHMNLLNGQVKELPFFLSKFNETLEGIRIYNSNLTHIYPDAFSGLSKVKFLDLSRNNLTAIPYAVSTLHGLQFLNISSNRLRNLEPQTQFSSWSKLKMLDLSGNYLDNIESLDLNGMSSSLERLILDNNDISALPANWTQISLPQLREITLNNNAITKLPPFSGKLLPELKVFRVRKNALEGFPFYFLPYNGHINQSIDLSGNPLRCDCKALWMREWKIEASKTSMIHLPECAFPASLRSSHLETMDPASLSCPAPVQPVSIHYRVSSNFSVHSILALTTLEHSISVTWSVKDKALHWSVLYRKESDSPYAMKVHNRSSEGTHSSSDDAVFTDIVSNLESDTLYIVCAGIQTSLNKFDLNPFMCQPVRTKSPKNRLISSQASSLFMAPNTEKRIVSKRAKTQLLVIKGKNKAIWLRWRLKIYKQDVTTEPNLLSAQDGILVKARSRRSTDPEFVASREWIILTRKIGTQNFTEVHVTDNSLSSKENNVYNYTISGLAGDTAYDCCLMPLDTMLEDTMADKSVPGGIRSIPEHLRSQVDQMHMMCKEIVTLSDSSSSTASSFSGSTIAVVTIISVVVTSIIVAVICCCCPASRNYFLRCSDSITQTSPCKSASTDKTFSVDKLHKNNSINSTKNLVNFMENEPTSFNNQPMKNVLTPQDTIRKIPMKPPNMPLPPIPTESVRSKSRSENFEKIATLDAGRLHLMYSEWEEMPSIPTPTRNPTRRAKSECRAPNNMKEYAESNLNNIDNRIDSFKSVRTLPRGQVKMRNSDGGSFHDSTSNSSSEEDRRIMKIRKIQRNKTLNFAGYGYVDSQGIQYLDGRKVQVFSLGSKTLPKSILRKGRPVAASPQQLRVPGRATATRAQSQHSRSFKKPARSPVVLRRGSQARGSQRLSFMTFGKDELGIEIEMDSSSPCHTDSASLSVTSNSDNCCSTKQLCSNHSSDCEVFIEHV